MSAIHEDATSVFNVGNKDIPDWMRDIIQYKETRDFSADPIHAKKLKLKSLQFCMVVRELYKKAKNGPLLKGLTPSEADYILREVYEWCCSHHLGARALAHKAIRIGYYWPTATKDAKYLVQNCEKYQNLHQTSFSQHLN